MPVARHHNHLYLTCKVRTKIANDNACKPHGFCALTTAHFILTWCITLSKPFSIPIGKQFEEKRIIELILVRNTTGKGSAYHLNGL